MKKLFFLFFILVASKALAQHPFPASLDTTRDFINDTLFIVGQESIPPNDSGGRWIKTTLLFTSCSSWPVHIGLQSKNPNTSVCHYAPEFSFKPDDSAWFIADSLMLVERSSSVLRTISFPSPWEYKDSFPPAQQGKSFESPLLQFTIPPHKTLRIPYLLKAIGPFPPPIAAHDTLDASEIFYTTQYPWRGGLDWFSDSTAKTIVRRMPLYASFGYFPLHLYAMAPSSAPYTISFKGWTNKDKPVVLGQYPPWYTTFQDTINAYQTTRTKYEIVGEFADRFIPPPPSDSIIRASCSNDLPQISWTFDGAPKSVVHDTLVSTFTDGWGSIITRTPIEAYTVVRGGYAIRSSKTVTAPFLGNANDTIFLVNLSAFPIQLKNLNLQNTNGQISFKLISAPNIIAAHDSGFIIVALLDNDKWRDADNPTRNATLTGFLVPYQTDITFLDSGFTAYINGQIDVYCPFSQNYFYYPPKIEHAIHPKGIVFISNYISNKCSAGKSFITIFANNDSVSEYFYLPYYDDPHFTIAIDNYCGFGTATLPGLIPPDTHIYIPAINTINALTTFSGDDNHNYLTKLHWPRTNDTVTMDVIALGANAPPFDRITTNSTSSGISVWPNPASLILHVRSSDKRSGLWITDALGRIVKKGNTEESEIDVSQLPEGLYELVFPDSEQISRLQIIR